MSWLLLEYRCDCGVTIESLERRGEEPPTLPCRVCGGTADRAISAVRSKTVWGAAVSTGKSDPPPPGVMDTRGLAEGMSYAEFRQRRRQDRIERRRRSFQ